MRKPCRQGRRCGNPKCSKVGADAGRQHPLGGDSADIIAAVFREALLYLARTTDASVDNIHSAAPATGDEIGGVGALLRFSLDSD